MRDQYKQPWYGGGMIREREEMQAAQDSVAVLRDSIQVAHY